MLRLCLHTLGDHEQSKMPCDGHNSFDQFGTAVIHLRHKLPVDLHKVEGKTAEQIEVAVLRTEVVDGEANATCLECLEDFHDPGTLVQQKAFGEFEHQADT